MSKYGVARSCVHQIYNSTWLDVKAVVQRRIDLRDDHDVPAVQDAQVARLSDLVSQALHNWQRLRDQALRRRVLLR
jgi:hypothetical protein